MTGHRPFKELRDKLHATPEGRAAARRARLNLEIMLKLAQIREMRGMTQVELAEVLQVSQANISRVEHAEDLNLSSLRNYIEGLGGTLHITAVFPDATLPIEGAEAQ